MAVLRSALARLLGEARPAKKPRRHARLHDAGSAGAAPDAPPPPPDRAERVKAIAAAVARRRAQPVSTSEEE